jgi:RNA polymerase sigma-70 factor (ECF subfamily)
MGGGRRSNRLQSGDDSSLALLHRAQEGDAEAREQLYRRLLPIMRCWARGQVPEKARGWLDSDDLVQTTMTETLARVQLFEPRRDHGLHLYLREALRNQIRDELRRLYRDPERAEELPESVPDDAPSPYENTASDESRERYESALAELPEAERTMVVSRVEFGLSWHDIAELSGKPSADAARMAVSRALVQIARAMGADERD